MKTDPQSILRWTSARAAFPVVVSGPSGVGKTSLVDRLLLLDPGCTRSVSATTRRPRANEVEGESYFFVDEDRFRRLVQQNALAESASYNGAWYGTPRSFLETQVGAGRCVILNIEVQGGLQVRRAYADALLVFVLPPSWEELRRRLQARRTDPPDVVEGRIQRAREELEEIVHYDYVVVNDDLDRCAGELAAILRAERRSVGRLKASAPDEPDALGPNPAAGG